MASTQANKKFLNRKLPERSYLDFEYESPGIPNYLRLPFFENIKISETRQSNLATHSPIGRNSPLFSWIGAGARTISLQFNFTLPLLIETALTLDQYRSISEPTGFQHLVSSEQRNNAYFPNIQEGDIDNAKNIAKIVRDEYIEEIKKEGITTFLNRNRQLNNEELKEFQDYVDQDQDRKEATDLFNSALTSTFDAIPNALTQLAEFFKEDDPSKLRKDQIIAIIMFWITVVRTSVLNNAENPKYGPPLIRLNHGVMFREIPCVCQDYSIKFDDKAGFDMKTLLPRVITVTMKLLEVRVGDFSTFKHSDVLKKFNNVGWEVLINDDKDVLQTIDPGKDFVF